MIKITEVILPTIIGKNTVARIKETDEELAIKRRKHEEDETARRSSNDTLNTVMAATHDYSTPTYDSSPSYDSGSSYDSSSSCDSGSSFSSCD